VETVRSHRLGVDLRRFRLIEVSDLSDDLLRRIFFIVGGRRDLLVETTRGELQAKLVVASFGLLEPRLDLAATGDWDLDHGFHGFLSCAHFAGTRREDHMCGHLSTRFMKKSENNFFGGLIAPIKSSPACAEESLQKMPRIPERFVVVLDFRGFSVGVKQDVYLRFDRFSRQDVECGLGHQVRNEKIIFFYIGATDPNFLAQLRISGEVFCFNLNPVDYRVFPDADDIDGRSLVDRPKQLEAQFN
jgi:hypothetical protein